MERRLFDDLVVSRAAARKGHGAMPISFVIHAVGLTTVLLLTAFVPEDMPAPPMPPLVLMPPDVAVRPPAGGPPRARASAPRSAQVTRAALVLRTEAPVAPTESDVLDPEAADPCPDCEIGDPEAPVGLGGPGSGAVGDRPGDGAGGGEQGPARVRVGGQVQPPRKIRHVDPVFPELARKAGVSAVVILECVIGRDGRIASVSVLRGHPLLDAAAVDAVRQWTYRPTLLNGSPVEVVMSVTIHFTATR